MGKPQIGDKIGQESPRAGDEPGPEKLTLYFSIPLENGMPDVTGVFFPEKFVPSTSLDVILFLQGKRDKDQCSGKPSDTIKEFWKNKQNFPLREGLNQTGRNFVLVAPSLSAGARSGNMMESGGADLYLKRVMDAIGREDPFKKGWKAGSVSVGNIFLAAHSGGGWTMSHIVSGITVGHVCECWAFDALYDSGSVPLLFKWAQTGGTLWVYYSDAVKYPVKMEKDVNDNQHLKNMGNVHFYDARNDGVEHCDVPNTYWQARIKGATCPKQP